MELDPGIHIVMHSVLSLTPGVTVKRKLTKMIKEKAILEAQLRGDQELPPEYDSDKSIEYMLESPPRKRVHYGEPVYRTRYH
jgi:hypothetical protein